ncbi:uncharacterized protein LOC118407817 [Branchiostoma floridae]|uniref:Uncharacterized protein LOC118407817 n=1 Tax=Branchiostoma floridae TaxID=7739 RepID=A0A9J7HR28_BRAFL|nr:uncharacterized protein LOC118407817 [Branchiostoma floridae]
MSYQKLFPNSGGAPEGSVGRHGDQRISLVLSGLSAVVSLVTLLFMMRELASMRDQQVLLHSQLQGLMQWKQDQESKSRPLHCSALRAQLKDGDLETAPPFGKVEKCTSEPRGHQGGHQQPVLMLSLGYCKADFKDSDVCLEMEISAPNYKAQQVHLGTLETMEQTDNKAHPVHKVQSVQKVQSVHKVQKARPVRKARPVQKARKAQWVHPGLLGSVPVRSQPLQPP